MWRALHLGDGLAGFESEGASLVACTEGGARLAADLVILAIGVRAETALAVAAGLPLGERGGIAVDAQMRTGDPHIWAVGDAVEVQRRHHRPGGDRAAGGSGEPPGTDRGGVDLRPAARFRGVQGTAMVGSSARRRLYRRQRERP